MRASCLSLLFAGCLISLQCVDFWLTRALLEGGVRADVYEANPLAKAVLARQGWSGVAVFKGLCTAVALGAGLIASVRRPAVGLRLLAAECLVMSGVVGWSAMLVRQPSESQDTKPVSGLEQRSHQLLECLAVTQQFHEARVEICRLVIRGETSLHVGLERLRECIESNRSMLSRAQQESLPDTRHTAQVAAYLYHHCSRLLERQPGGAMRLELLGQAISQRFPTAPLVKIDTLSDLPAPNWSSRFTNGG